MAFNGEAKLSIIEPPGSYIRIVPEKPGITGRSVGSNREALMAWQYRVMDIEGQHAIYEVHYDTSLSPIRYSSIPTYPRGEQLSDLAADLALYREALTLPVLRPEDFPVDSL